MCALPGLVEWLSRRYGNERGYHDLCFARATDNELVIAEVAWVASVTTDGIDEQAMQCCSVVGVRGAPYSVCSLTEAAYFKIEQCRVI